MATYGKRRITTLATLALLAVSVVASQGAQAQQGTGPSRGAAGAAARYEIGLLGDMPYGDVGRTQYPNVIADINRHRLAFSAFDGDTKNGSERCDDGFYPANKAAYFDTFRQPIVYVVGDNEWTDCDRASDGGYDPTGRLALIRSTYFGSPFSLGQHKIRVQRQPGYPENQRWTIGAVTYVGVNIVGSDNNFPVYDSTGKQVDGDASEALPRDAANQRWLQDTFALAKREHSKAVMIVIQADMDWYGQFKAAGSATDGFDATKKTLLRQTIAFPGQVVLVNGDSHTFIVDKPLADPAGNLVENFTRVQTFGSAQNHWVSATVDPRDPNVFEFHQHIVTANLLPHTG